MFENNGYIHVYIPGAEADNPLGSFCSLKIHNLKMFEHNGYIHVHVYIPGAEADSPLGSFVSLKIYIFC